ncbi:unnamed protein product, partial [Heterotrigona itama]
VFFVLRNEKSKRSFERAEVHPRYSSLPFQFVEKWECLANLTHRAFKHDQQACDDYRKRHFSDWRPRHVDGRHPGRPVPVLDQSRGQIPR